FWLLMALAAVFMLSRFGETFLMLHANANFNLEVRYVPIIMLIFNAGWCLCAYPVGVLADRINRHLLLASGIIVLIVADYLLTTATSLFWIYAGCFFFQFPENFSFSPERLERLISQLEGCYKNVVEFRHPSWWHPSVVQALESMNVIFCTVNGFSLPDQLMITNKQAYLRFHGNLVNWH
ncbi:MAG: DUF72 domain-containing protein, partial [Alphaproteobacteria bacterium]|nr:DUF72 domain-containing protein [Alphaproteobacteria bacterium]